MNTTAFDNLQYELLCLADPVVLPAHKLRATAALLAGGKQAIEILVDRFEQDDDPIFMDNLLVPTGVMNPGLPRQMSVTVKFQIENILYQILYPEQAPRPELKGETAPTTRDSGPTHAAAPAQTLAEMKADWDNARDIGIDSLSPSELGAAYAFVSDWKSWWKDHGNKELSELKDWSRDQVQRRWELNMITGEQKPPRPPIHPRPSPGMSPENIETLKSQYQQAWVLFEGAQGNPARTPVATKALKQIQSRHPYLTPHIQHLLQQLA